MFRQLSAGRMAHPPKEGEPRVAPCPQCGEVMINLGKDFKAPKQGDVEQWKKVQLLYQHGYTFHSCGCGGPGPRPEKLREVEAFVQEQARLRAELDREQRLAAEAAERNRKRKKAAQARLRKRLVRQAAA